MTLKITIKCFIDRETEMSWTFDGKTPVRLGRAADNDVVLAAPEHRSVSGHHAVIRVEGRAVIIRDIRSANGLFVDDKKVDVATLKSGSQVRLGNDGPIIDIVVDGIAATTDTLVIQQDPAKKYGERTVGMMIHRALAQAGLVKPPGTSKSTDYFEKMVEDRVNKTSTRVKWFVSLTALTLVLGGVALGIYLHRNRSVQYIQQTNVNYGEAVGSQVAAANRYSVFLVAGVSAETQTYQGFCTAFALSADVLATNAHCVLLALKHYQRPVVIMNGTPSTSYEILRASAHPGYQDGRISMDVGLIRIKGTLPYTVTPATNEELAQLSPGLPVFLYGFPGRLNNVATPEATFVTGEIGRVTGLDQSPRDFAQNLLIQHSAYTSAGTSGSPLFNGAGHVIGINTGGYTENGQALTGYNFGMRIDAVYALIPGI